MECVERVTGVECEAGEEHEQGETEEGGGGVRGEVGTGGGGTGREAGVGGEGSEGGAGNGVCAATFSAGMAAQKLRKSSMSCVSGIESGALCEGGKESVVA